MEPARKTGVEGIYLQDACNAHASLICKQGVPVASGIQNGAVEQIDELI
jgi:hypothetical protein